MSRPKDQLRVDAAVKEVPELQAVEDARMGMTEDKMSLGVEHG